MSDPIYQLLNLRISGFRAYLDPQTFEFSAKPCLAVFAPNGRGKTSTVDALEFLFSEEGTLDRLGLRRVENQAGPEALVHNLAEEKGISSSVQVIFKKGKEKVDGTRVAVGPDRKRPEIATKVKECFVAEPIIHGHSLRRFVEEESAERRYENIAGWLRLGPFVEVQKNLRSLLQALKAAAEDPVRLRNLDTQLTRKTAKAVTTWDDGEVLAFSNRLLGRLDKSLVMAALDPKDPAWATAIARKRREEQGVGIAGLRQVRNSSLALIEEEVKGETGDKKIKGLLPAYVSAVQELDSARSLEQQERGRAADAAFEELWKAAETLFAEGAPPQGTCPICRTPIEESPAASLEGIRSHLLEHRKSLKNYADAKSAVQDAEQVLRTARVRLVAGVKTLIPLLDSSQATLEKDLKEYLEIVEAGKGGTEADTAQLREALLALSSELQTAISRIQSEQGEDTYSQVVSKIEDIFTLGNERGVILRTQEEMGSLMTALDVQAAFIKGELRTHVQGLLDSLQEPVNEIYAEIQGSEAVPIRLELPREEDRNQQRLKLVVDFAPNRTGVQPSGYLSDSQIHSLALALRLAAIRKFNGGAPLIVFDDIVTSYDSDHRRKLAGLLAKEFGDFQILLTTHDERFFLYLKDQLGSSSWQYKRISRLDSGFGPRFEDHRVTDEMIEARWEGDQSAANEMRQAEEEWLLGVCRDFGVEIRIRPVDRAYTYDRAELAGALAAFLKVRKLKPPVVPGVNNRFLTSLQQGTVENFGSHFQPAPYGAGSPGDEKARWEEFKVFRAHFVCPRCGKKRFKRPGGMKGPACANEKCEAQFEFPSPESGGEDSTEET